MDLQPPREWEPELEDVVLDQLPNSKGRRGTVVRVDRYGHFADPYWRASVLWDDGVLGHDIETSWLTREDGTQGALPAGSDPRDTKEN